jgi:hypothetical protein
MALKDLVGKVAKQAEGLTDAAEGKLNELLDDYKKLTGVLERFGFKVGKFTVGIGVLPEIHTTISGSIEDLREESLKQMIAEHQGEATLVSLLKALVTAKQIWEHVELKLTAVTLDVTLGLAPKVAVDFH